jgi:phage-related minor tail protein
MAEVGSLNINMSLNSAEFQKGLKDVNNRLKIAQSEFKLAGAGVKDFEKSLDGLKAKSKYLQDTLQLQQQKVNQLKERFEQLKATKGEDDAATQRMLIAYNNATAAMRRTESQLSEVNRQIRTQSSGWYDLGQRMTTIGKSFKEVGEKLKGAGEALTKSITLPLVGLGAAAVDAAQEVDSSTKMIQAQLGLTEKEASKLADTAKNIWKQGFGESMDEVRSAVTKVNQNIQNLNNQDLGIVTKNALILSKVFDADIGDSTKTVSALMKNFGINSTKAFDIITTGFQKGGDFSGELLDTLNEYSVQFSSMGLSAEQFLSILISGAQSGAFNLDKVGDAVKEFNIRAQDGSKTTSDGFKMLGLNAGKMGEAISKGGEAGQGAFVATLSALANMKDPLKQNQAGVALFGTQWEDVRKKVVFSMSEAVKNVQSVDGATEKAGKAVENSFGQKTVKIWREFKSALQPIGDILLNLAEKWMPKISKAFEVMTNWFGKLSPGMQTAILAFGAFAAALGPLLMSIGMIANGIGVVLSWFGPLAGAIADAGGLMAWLGPIFTAITGPIGITIAAVAGLVAIFIALWKNNEAFRNKVMEIWTNIKNFFALTLNFISESIVKPIMSSVLSFVSDILSKLKAFWDENGQAIMTICSTIFSGIWNEIKYYFGLIKGIFQILWPILVAVVKIAWASLKLTIMNALDIILGTVRFFAKLFTGDWKGAFSTALDVAQKIFNNIKKVFKDLDLAKIGKDIISGLLNGLESMVGAVKEKVKGIAKLIPDGMKKFLGIHSPSRVMAEQVGKWIPAGLAEGISNNIGAINTASTKMAGSVIGSVDTTIPKSQQNLNAKQPVILQMVMPNERVMAEWLVDDITDIQNFKSNRLKVFG